MQSLKKPAILLIFMIWTLPVLAQIYSGSGRLTHVMTSEMLGIAGYKLSILSSNGMVPGDFTGQSASNPVLTQNYVGFDYGVGDYFQISSVFNVLQMNHSDTKSEMGVGPVSLAAKLGNLEFLEGRVKTGLLIGTTIAIGNLVNKPFYPYYSGTVEFGFLSYTSWYLDPDSPEQGSSLHFNLMMLTHNDGQLDVSKVTGTPYELPGRGVGVKYGIGYLYPYGSWNFYSELWGEWFFKQPNPVIYSRESFAYLNGGMKYNFTYWDLSLSADVLLIGNTEETDYVKSAPIGYPQVLKEAKNYAPFMINAGININFSDIVNSWMGYSVAVYNYNQVPADQYTEDLRKDDVLTKIEMEYYRNLYQCFKSAKRYDENLKGTLYIDFTVKPDGTVENEKVVISTFDSAFTYQVEQCMIGQVKEWVFPKGEKPLRFEILPLNFQ